ncbi:hypothetical protein [Saccharicrinis sp. 156]|uniref:hypothetical protein n=1 Tax=Saccharicrinis sp. 156 TaxID=3417574 RepID=UPI003D32E789
MEHVQHDGKVGFWGGFVVAAFTSIDINHVVETIIYTAIGTVVSFFVSKLLRYLMGKFKGG